MTKSARMAHALILIISIAVGFNRTASAQTTATWLTAASGNWIDPINWSTSPVYPNNGQPTSGDTYQAVIGATGASYTVSLPAALTSVDSLWVTSPDATISQQGGTLSLLNGGTISTGTYLMQNSTLTGGDLTIGGRMIWNGGTISGSGIMTVAPGAVLDVRRLAGSGGHHLLRQLSNQGTINLGDYLDLYSSGIITNLSGGFVRILPGGHLFDFSTPALNNQGTVQFDNGTIATGLSKLINAGTIIVNGSSATFGSGTHLSGSTISGAGRIDFGSGTHTFLGTTTLAGANMNARVGTFQGSGDIILTGTLNVPGGSITNTLNGTGTSNASLTITPTGILNLGQGAGSGVRFQRPVFNSGVFNLNGGSVSLSKQATITNQTGGVMNIGTNTLLYGTSGLGTLLNSGTINVAVAPGAQSFFPFSDPWSITNSGVISADSGSFLLPSGTCTNQSGSTFKGASTLVFGNSYQNVLGNTTLAGAHMRLFGALFQGPGNINLTGTLDWAGGTFGAGIYNVNGVGSLSIAPSGVLNINSAGSFTALRRQADNYGVVNFNSGTVLIQETSFNNRAGGVLTVTSAKNFVGAGSVLLFNSGTLNISSASVAFSIPIANAGTINGPLVTATQPVMLLDGANTATIDGDGTLSVYAAATATVAHVRQRAVSIGPFATLKINPAGGVVDATSTAKSLQFEWSTSKLDLADNSFIIDYDTEDPIASIRAAVVAGQIVASVLPAGHRLGFHDNTPGSPLTTFGGLAVDDTSILIGPALLGDTNLDGFVDVTDLGALATHWQSSGDWPEGDFNADHRVDVTDLGMLAHNWQTGSSGGMSIAVAMAAVGLGDVWVPEPTVLGCVTCVTVAWCARRRRA